MNAKIKVGYFVHVSRPAAEFPAVPPGQTSEEKQEAVRRIPSVGVVVYVHPTRGWATVRLYAMVYGVPTPLYCECFSLEKLNRTRAPRGVRTP